ncbi:VOC family protein [Candidatus Giovannonibacteria bacterium]|nr:VOC family protein [Candidatus Giovannonibacteria bacterium]
MPRKERLFMPMGVDHIVIACYSRHYWRHVLKHIGFQEYVSPIYKGDSDTLRSLELMYGASLKFGDVKFLLVDPSTGTYNPKQIHEFLVRNGDFQVSSVGIAVDSVVRAQEEIGGSFAARCDPFGEASRMIFLPPMQTSFWWEFIEREESAEKVHGMDGPLCVDHIAIAVENLKEAQKAYQKLGFKTVYHPRSEIRGEYSGMNTAAMQRDDWSVALVKGVDGAKRSQVTSYLKAHGNHSVQHIALRFANVESAIEKMFERQVNFRTHAAMPIDQSPPWLLDVIHYGKDHAGHLLQAFTKPFLRFIRWDEGGVFTADGLFFECIERLRLDVNGRRGFSNKTVKGLYRSIEDEELSDGEEGSGTLLSHNIMSRFEYDARFATLTKRGL